jgi:hypothetical protein
MQKIVWDDDELDEHIIDVLKKSTTIENPLAPNTILNKLKEEYKNVKLGIIRVKDSLNRLSDDKIKKTSGTHPKYYIEQKRKE